MNNELKNKYPKTWIQFKEYCKQKLGEQKGLEALAMFPEDKTDDLATLVISMNPSVITDFFDSKGIYMVTNIDQYHKWFAYSPLREGTDTVSKFDTRPEALVDGYKKSFEIYENQLSSNS